MRQLDRFFSELGGAVQDVQRWAATLDDTTFLLIIFLGAMLLAFVAARALH